MSGGEQRFAAVTQARVEPQLDETRRSCMADTRGTGTSVMTGRLGVAAAVSAIAAVLYGYDTGIISGALLQIKDEFHIGSTWQQLIAASILLGAIVGAL